METAVLKKGKGARAASTRKSRLCGLTFLVRMIGAPAQKCAVSAGFDAIRLAARAGFVSLAIRSASRTFELGTNVFSRHEMTRSFRVAANCAMRI
jgi:hypothetical protein